MVLTTRLYTTEDLWTMPSDEPWELWDGELKKVPSAGGEASGIAAQVIISIGIYLRATKLGHITGADGSYVLFRENGRDTVVVPDVAFVRWDRLPDGKPPKRHVTIPPDLAVEVQSPSDEPADMAAKRALYARAGVPLLWWVDPITRTVTIHRPGHPPITFTGTDTLDGADVLPGLAIPLADIFS